MEFLNRQKREREIIWIDENINNTENTSYMDQLSTLYNLPIEELNSHKFTEVKSSIDYLKKLFFIEVIIIVSGRLYFDFVEELEKNLKDICAIPKIIIFTSVQRVNYCFPCCSFERKVKKLNKFYYYGGIKTSFEEVKSFIDSQEKENQLGNNAGYYSTGNINTNTSYISSSSGKEEYLFDPIKDEEDLILPTFYKILLDISEIKNNNTFIEKMCKNYKGYRELSKLFFQIRSIPGLPIEILSKYYARLYTLETPFYKDTKRKLLSSNESKDLYEPYVKTLYLGLEKGSLKTCSEKELYSAAYISQEEINQLFNLKKTRIRDLPMSVIFSKSFISFSKDLNIAESFFSSQKNVMLFLEKDDQIKFDLLTHADIENISYFNDKSYNEKEVLFFPFSAFGINEIEKINDNRYHIKLIYLGKFISKFESKKKFNSSKDKLPNSHFKELFKKSGLVDEQRVENLKVNEVVKTFKKYKESKNYKRNNKALILIAISAVIFISSLVALFVLLKKGNDKKCKAGYYSEPNLNNSICYSCEPGYYSKKGATNCTKCPAGYSSDEGAGKCFKCPAGTYSNETDVKCSECPEGYFSKKGSSKCEICQEGTYSNEERTDCEYCSPGTYSEKGSSKCIECPAGTISDNHWTSCISCSPGTYSEEPGSIKCFKCPKGTYSYDYGSTSCLDCRAGTISIEDRTDCDLCGPGHYSDQGSYTCRECPPGTYSNKWGSEFCINCPEGTHPNLNKTVCIDNSQYFYSIKNLMNILILLCLLYN